MSDWSAIVPIAGEASFFDAKKRSIIHIFKENEGFYAAFKATWASGDAPRSSQFLTFSCGITNNYCAKNSSLSDLVVSSVTLGCAAIFAVS